MYFHINNSQFDRDFLCTKCGETADKPRQRKRRGRFRNGRTVCCNAKWVTSTPQDD